MPSVSGVRGVGEAGLGAILPAGVAQTRPKARDKHVDALRQKLSDGGSIPPASTTTHGGSLLATGNIFWLGFEHFPISSTTGLSPKQMGSHFSWLSTGMTPKAQPSTSSGKGLAVGAIS